VDTEGQLDLARARAFTQANIRGYPSDDTTLRENRSIGKVKVIGWLRRCSQRVSAGHFSRNGRLKLSCREASLSLSPSNPQRARSASLGEISGASA
jgi:hypothetical protein